MISWLAPMALVRKETSGWRRAFFTALRRLPALPRTAARYSASFRKRISGARLDHGGGESVLNGIGIFCRTFSPQQTHRGRDMIILHVLHGRRELKTPLRQ